MDMLIRFFTILIAVVVCLMGGTVLYAQSAGPAAEIPPGIPAGTELQNIERTLARSGISAAERQDALIRLARLRQLSGDIEGAAQSWLEAAPLGAEQGDDALVTGASCLIAIGEWEKAVAALKPLLASGRRGPALLRARYVDASLKAWNSGDASSLSALANDPEYAELLPLIYYTLWKTAEDSADPAAETWKARLLAEFPRIPEARIAALGNGTGASPVTVKPSPLWLLLPGRDGFSFTATAPAGATASPSITASSTANAADAQDSGAKVLQTGLFSSETNAKSHAERLKTAGFSPSLVRRAVNGGDYWAVTVPAGQNTTRAIQELRNAGFESFPLF
jgi:tetratricopeptide (TPR) repeat protein